MCLFRSLAVLMTLRAAASLLVVRGTDPDLENWLSFLHPY